MAKAYVKGPIISNDEKWIYDWFGIEATCAKDIENALEKANGEDLEVLINSPGGYVDVGSEIFTLLKDYKGKTTGKILGIAASAASVASMGVDELLISPTARIMIHNAACVVRGDYRDMDHGSEVLKDCNEAISNAYALKTGLDKETLLDLMNKETFMNAQKAKELKFVDGIMFDNNNRLVNNSNESGMLPVDVIEKIRNMKEQLNLENKETNLINENPKQLEQNEINKLKEKLAFKNKNVSSFLLCQKERML